MIEVLDLNQPIHRRKYEELIKGLGQKRPYDSLDFFLNFSGGYENLVCISVIESENLFLLPGYLRPIPDFNSRCDFISPYGYSGPILSKVVEKGFLKNAWSEIEKFFISSNVISCFLRFALDAKIIGFPGEVIPTMKNIRGEILPEERQWAEFDSKVRKNVNKALREGLTFKIISGSELNDVELLDFYNIYEHTMVRNNAKDYFFYSIDTFKTFANKCGSLCSFSFVYYNNKPVSVEMILISDSSIFSFLGGTLSDTFDKRPNDLIKFELINWARKSNFKYFVLGGGYGSEDGIFKYKKSFFPKNEVDYLTGRWIISMEDYNLVLKELKTRHELLYGFSKELEQKDFFPSYRKYLD